MPDLIAPKMTDNQALRRIVAMLDAVIQRLLGEYTQITGSNEIELDADDETELRAQDGYALATVVTNIGETRVRIFESGHVVATLWPDQTWESPTSGKLRITATSLGAAGSVAIATYKHP
jgi:hypothetical protein